MSRYDFSREAAGVMNSPYWGLIPDWETLPTAAYLAETNRLSADRDRLEEWFGRHPDAESADELPPDLRGIWDAAMRVWVSYQDQAEKWAGVEAEDVLAGEGDEDEPEGGEEFRPSAEGEKETVPDVIASGTNYVPPGGKK